MTNQPNKYDIGLMLFLSGMLFACGPEASEPKQSDRQSSTPPRTVRAATPAPSSHHDLSDPPLIADQGGGVLGADGENGEVLQHHDEVVEPGHVFDSEPERPSPLVSIEPYDLSSAVGNAPLRIAVNNYGSAVAEDALRQLASSIRLVTWPAENAVKISTEIVNAVGPDANAARQAYIYVRPAQALSESWHALAISSLPAALAWPAYLHTTELKSHARAARFRLGSDPVLKRLRVCNKPVGGSRNVIAEFSERIQIVPSIANAFVVASNDPAVSCKAIDPPAENREVLSLTAVCSKGHSGDTLTASIAVTDLRASSGVRLHDVSASTMEYTLKSDALADGGDGCGVLAL